MKTEQIKVILILLVCIGCLIGCAWIHCRFLIILSLFAIGLCVWILWRIHIIQQANERRRKSREITMNANHKAELQHHRDAMWREFLTYESWNERW